MKLFSHHLTISFHPIISSINSSTTTIPSHLPSHLITSSLQNRACAKNTDAIFLKLSGPQLVQMYIGDGSKMVRDGKRW